jgi:hypothetical protein
MISGFQEPEVFFITKRWIAAGFSVSSPELIAFLSRVSDHLLLHFHGFL